MEDGRFLEKEVDLHLLLVKSFCRGLQGEQTLREKDGD